MCIRMNEKVDYKNLSSLMRFISEVICFISCSSSFFFRFYCNRSVYFRDEDEEKKKKTSKSKFVIVYKCFYTHIYIYILYVSLSSQLCVCVCERKSFLF